MNILIIDDEPKVKNGMHKLIEERYGHIHRIYSLDDSAKALELINNYKFDLVFIDLVMPKHSGFDLIEALRSKEQKTYIVILSGYSYFSYAQQAIDLCVNKYLTKPSDPKEIIDIVENVGKDLSDTNIFKQYYQGDNPIILSSFNYIARNYNNKITLDDIADELFTSPTYVSKLFKKETRKNFSDFLIDFRMDKAKYYLEETNIQIFDISQMVGYQDAGYFSSSFKRKFGKTPLEYRNSEANRNS